MSNYYRNAKPKHFRRAYPPSWNQHDRFDYGIHFFLYSLRSHWGMKSNSWRFNAWFVANVGEFPAISQWDQYSDHIWISHSYLNMMNPFTICNKSMIFSQIESFLEESAHANPPNFSQLRPFLHFPCALSGSSGPKRAWGVRCLRPVDVFNNSSVARHRASGGFVTVTVDLRNQ